MYYLLLEVNPGFAVRFCQAGMDASPHTLAVQLTAAAILLPWLAGLAWLGYLCVRGLVREWRDFV